MRGLSPIFIRVPTGLTGRATSPLRSTEIPCASSGSADWSGPLALVTVDTNVDRGTEWLAWWLIPPGQPIPSCPSSLPRPSGDSGLGSYDRVARDETPIVVDWSCGKPWMLTRRVLSEATSQAVQTSHSSSWGWSASPCWFRYGQENRDDIGGEDPAAVSQLLGLVAASPRRRVARSPVRVRLMRL